MLCSAPFYLDQRETRGFQDLVDQLARWETKETQVSRDKKERRDNLAIPVTKEIKGGRAELDHLGLLDLKEL